MCHDLLTLAIFESEAATRKWRRDACVAVRAFLCSHPDASLHPVQRDHTNSVVNSASPEEHALAFLEHHRHAVAIINFFLTYTGPRKDEAKRGFRVVVYTRFDGDVVDPFIDAPTLPSENDIGLPLIDLHLYNNTGNGVSGFHYDPVFLHAPRQRQDASPKKRTRSNVSSSQSPPNSFAPSNTSPPLVRAGISNKASF